MGLATRPAAMLLALLLLVPCGRAAAATGDAAQEFWSRPRRGANLFDRRETGERLRAAAAAGIEWVRLAPDKWEGAGRDFLMGDADSFAAVPPRDLAHLRAVLDSAQAAGVKVALVMLGVPGARWRQNNGNRSDFRLYRDARTLARAERFWTALATELRGHPALVAYDLLNEPHPRRAGAAESARLDEVLRRLHAAVRSVDPVTPVLLEGDDFASPSGLAALRPLEDPRVLYSFHFYEPWAYVDHRQRGRWSYPGAIPAGDDTARLEMWGPERVEAALGPVLDWQARWHVPSGRMVCAEFGVPRTHPGAEMWLRDVVRACERHGWHWAFYAFREDTWPAMDYELGSGAPPRGYWEAVDAGLAPTLPRPGGAAWDVLRRALAGDTSTVASPVKRR